MAREINTLAVGHVPSQFSLDGLLINGLEVRVGVQNPFVGDISRPTASKMMGFRGDFRSGKPVKPTASTGFLERAGNRTHIRRLGLSPEPGGFNRILRLVRLKNKNKVRQKTSVPRHPTRLP
jgi:hypothetical protein